LGMEYADRSNEDEYGTSGQGLNIGLASFFSLPKLEKHEGD